MSTSKYITAMVSKYVIRRLTDAASSIAVEQVAAEAAADDASWRVGAQVRATAVTVLTAVDDLHLDDCGKNSTSLDECGRNGANLDGCEQNTVQAQQNIQPAAFWAYKIRYL